MINTNRNDKTTSLQVSRLYNIPEGNFIVSDKYYPVLIKNITDENVTLEVLLADSNEYVSTILYPGWNPELIVGIKDVPRNTLQAGN